MRAIAFPALAMLLIALPLAAAGQEAATGTVQMERAPPPSRGVTVEQDGRPVTGTIPPGAAIDIQGANVVVEETPRATRVTVNNDLLFDFDKAELRPDAAEALGRVAEIIRQRRPRAVRIVGHTDSIGGEDYNRQLSQRRAQSVARWLAAQGGALPPMETVGRGEAEPVAPNTTEAGADNPEGRQRNRRVEVLLER